MVDFQSRNTRRGTGDDEEPETEREETDAADDGGATDSDAGGDQAYDRSGGEGGTVSVALVTVSEARTAEADPPADAVRTALESAGHEVVTRDVLRPAHDTVQATVDTIASREDVDAVVTTGGTGVAPGDVTVEAVHPLVDKALPGFGEAFRRRYAVDAGSDAVATRAMAGLVDTTPVFCLPGDEQAARVGTAELVVEQADRLSRLASSDGPADP